MKIALRRKPATDANFVDVILGKLIKYKLATIWPHVGFVIDDVFYHSSGRHGLEVTTLTEAKWDIIDVGNELDKQAIEIFNNLVSLKAGYDWVELFDFTPLKPFIKLAHKNKKIKQWLDNNVYCYQLVLWVLRGTMPLEKATPELILFEIVKILKQKHEKSLELDLVFKRNNNDGE